jgi:two-component system cell cycle response regulator DivK
VHTVLIVDDNQAQREMYRRLLDERGYTVLEAGSATEAFSIARCGRVSLILMDVYMPDINGLLATEMLKADPETSAIPVICLTAFDIAGELATAAGALRLLRRPIPPKMLARAVEDAIGGMPEQAADRFRPFE